MNLFRNPELKKSMVFQIILCAIAAVGCCFFSMFSAVIVMALSAVLIITQLVFYKKRYQKIVDLYEDMNKVLNGNDEITFSAYEEGELSILKSEISKMTLKLREHNSILMRDKIVLKDSLADISHQLKTPLTSMNLILTLMSRENLTSEQRMSHLRSLSELLSHTEQLIDILLKISRFDAGAVTLRKEEISCRELIKNAVSSLEIMAELRDVEIRKRVADETFKGDFNWCSEAVSNIVKNCIEHTSSLVEIEVKRTPVSVKIIIADNGNGIAQKDLPHIFDRFYRREDTVQSGYGIGLSLARKIITSQDGIIKVENGKVGARFIICFYHKQSDIVKSHV